MKNFFPIAVVVAVLAWIAVTLLPPRNKNEFDLVGFSQLPVLANGRIKPFDTVARSALLQLQSRQEVRNIGVKEPVVDSPTEWLLDVMFRPEKADTYQTFVIEHLEQADLVALIGRTPDNLKIDYANPVLKALAIADMLPKTQRRFSFQELLPHLKEIEDQARLADQVPAKVRTPFQDSVHQLYLNLRVYAALRHTAVAPDRPDFVSDLLRFQDKLPESIDAFRKKQAGQPHDEALVNNLMEFGERFDAMARLSTTLLVPPDKNEADDAWQTTGSSLLETFRNGRVNSSVLAYAGFAHAWRNQKPDEFNTLLGLFRKSLQPRFDAQLAKAGKEARFNSAAPFYTSTVLYAVAFFAAVFSWLLWPEALRRAAYGVLACAWVVATVGIATRMWLEDRPPVTNLYSSALWVGWGSVGLCLILEAIYKNAIPTVTAGVIGFGTLIIAHHLALSGDTLEMMQAVLDTNLWLATHVVIVTTGYAATFLAGFLGLTYIVLGAATPLLKKSFERGASGKSETAADTLGRMVYGIVCFATLCSFVGTVLGGIWADQSWGRFWGWDPKENGALLVVLWNAIILHARWGGMIRQRGLMCMAVFGNIVTSWSWFGTNMLGVGLHSYGFTGAAFVALMCFVASQLAIIALGGLTPLEKWRSFRAAPQRPLPEPAIAK